MLNCVTETTFDPMTTSTNCRWPLHKLFNYHFKQCGSINRFRKSLSLLLSALLGWAPVRNFRWWHASQACGIHLIYPRWIFIIENKQKQSRHAAEREMKRTRNGFWWRDAASPPRPVNMRVDRDMTNSKWNGIFTLSCLHFSVAKEWWDGKKSKVDCVF